VEKAAILWSAPGGT